MTQPSTGDQTEQPTDGQQPGGDTGSGSGSQPGGDAPTEITKDSPEITVVYGKDVTKATITVDDDDPNTEAFSKVLKFAPQIPEDGSEGGQTPPEDGSGEQPPSEEQPPAEEPPTEEPPAEEPPAEEPPAEEQPPTEEQPPADGETGGQSA